MIVLRLERVQMFARKDDLRNFVAGYIYYFELLDGRGCCDPLLFEEHLTGPLFQSP